MFKKTRVSTAAALLAGGLLPTLLVPAMAQSTGTTVEKVETVVVTGSRIVRPNLTSSTPVLAISAETMSNLGMENFADMATQLPQFSPAFGSSRTQSTFSGVESSGLNNANLRNLGANRSLVLINGRRVPGGTSTDTAVDFNSIPTANIERIEVITGGASAIYGADAMGGVINIITKKNFDGIELNVSYGESDKGDNKNPSASLLMGGKFGDAGRATLTFQFDKQGQVSCADREFCKDDFFWTVPDNPIFGPSARSGVGANGRFFIENAAAQTSASYTRRGSSFTNATGGLIPFATATDGYNRNGQRDLAIPTKRVLVAGEAEYKVNKNVTAFGEFNFANTSIASRFEGHPFQSSSDLYAGLEASIPVNNPFMPAALRNAMIAAGDTQMTWWQRFSDETMGGNRGATSERTMYRTVVGIKGELDTLAGFGNDWRWELSSTFGRTRVNLGTEGSVGRAQLYNGLRVSETAPGSGVYQCSDVAARGNGCVPINPFAPYTQAMKDYLMVDTRSTGQSSMNDTIASLSGSVFKLPAGDVRVAVGGQQRSLSGYMDHDTQINLGNVTGNQIGDTDYVKIKTKEVFAEILVPVLADKPFINSLNLEGAARHSSSGGKTYDTWKLGGDWEPVGGLRFRAMKARAVRTPVPGELSGIGQTFGVINDPCTATRRNLNAVRAANCATDGIPGNYAPAQSIEQSVEGFSGGNANLNPEKGTTWTYGFVFQPNMVKGLSIAVDRFEIRVQDMIKAISRQEAVNLCYDTTTRAYCDVVTRGTHPLAPGANYVLRSVNEQLKNVASMDIKGVDIDVRYGFKTGRFGDFDLSAIATIYDKASLLGYAGGPTIDLLGQAGGSTTDQGYIKFTANGSVGWKLGAFKANWNIRHIGKADMAPGTTEEGFPKIAAHTYHNVRVGYALNKGTELYAGVTNLFDKKPPLFASGTAGTQALDTIPGYYDVFGRSFFVGMNAKF
ncbi:TonB-dependent receptor domain-containing protein [Paucibacter sp. M5-1]|uniref:TonB-dependent receptor domain-containing protein n=1 Tax=Paucibacter sp. M5-1 TaxID=3015998 RepID=UPI0022B8B1B8|nr:TonB-dependent receptor [Paucibacter sp. M5-1]MCZ7881597.1 TonB-dependent receptor [Paucibacter sp. M5-1]